MSTTSPIITLKIFQDLWYLLCIFDLFWCVIFQSSALCSVCFHRRRFYCILFGLTAWIETHSGYFSICLSSDPDFFCWITIFSINQNADKFPDPSEAPTNVEAFAYSNEAVRVRWQPIRLRSGESPLDGYKVSPTLEFCFQFGSILLFSFLRHLFSPCSIVYVQSILLLDNRRLFLLFNWKCQLIKVGAFFIVHNSKVEMNSGTHFACNDKKLPFGVVVNDGHARSVPTSMRFRISSLILSRKICFLLKVFLQVHFKLKFCHVYRIFSPRFRIGTEKVLYHLPN